MGTKRETRLIIGLYAHEIRDSLMVTWSSLQLKASIFKMSHLQPQLEMKSALFCTEPWSPSLSDLFTYGSSAGSTLPLSLLPLGLMSYLPSKSDFRNYLKGCISCPLEHFYSHCNCKQITGFHLLSSLNYELH